MPVKLGSKLPSESAEARIEIVPLIDIMFFLLAAFMLVSLSMVNLKSVKMNLPTAVSASTDTRRDIANISVDRTGLVFIDKKLVDDAQLAGSLTAALKANPDLRVIISGDRDARHGVIIHTLDVVRSAGIDRVAFEISADTKADKP